MAEWELGVIVKRAIKDRISEQTRHIKEDTREKVRHSLKETKL